MVVLDLPPAPAKPSSIGNIDLFTTTLGFLVVREVFLPGTVRQLFVVEDEVRLIGELGNRGMVRVKKDGSPWVATRGSPVWPDQTDHFFLAPVTRAGVQPMTETANEPPPEYWPSQKVYLHGQGGTDWGASFFLRLRTILPNEVGIVTRSALSASCVLLALPCDKILSVRESLDGLTAAALTQHKNQHQVVVFDLD
jgi:hypothetical protein